MCLLSITENGEGSSWAGRGDTGAPSLGAGLTRMLPAGLVPKDYRSLKTQYLQVGVWGLWQSNRRGRLVLLALLLLAARHQAAFRPPQDPTSPSLCLRDCSEEVPPCRLPVPTAGARC